MKSHCCADYKKSSLQGGLPVLRHVLQLKRFLHPAASTAFTSLYFLILYYRNSTGARKLNEYNFHNVNMSKVLCFISAPNFCNINVHHTHDSILPWASTGSLSFAFNATEMN